MPFNRTAYAADKKHGSFFERLEPETQSALTIDDSNQVVAVVAAIKRHLQWLLNSRQGCSQSSPELGLADFNDATGGSTDFTVKITRNIKETIERYEPRVQIQDVVYCPNPDSPLELGFKVIGQLLIKQRSKEFLIELVLNGHNKHYKVS